jgi:predicted PurR-regulated permease PerM
MERGIVMVRRETDQLEAIERIATRARKLIPLVVIAAVVIVLAAARAAASVLIPLAFAFFLIAVFWPLQRRLQQRMPLSLAVTLTTLLLLVILALFVGTLWWSGRSVAGQWMQYQDELNHYLRLAQQAGLPLPDGEAATDAGVQSLATRLAGNLASVGGALFLVIAYLLLGSLEIGDYRAKLCTFLSRTAVDHWLAVAHEIAKDFQRYVVVRTGIGLLNGVVSGVAAWLIGLDFALIWGLITFLLNYIPTIGSVIAVIFPVLFALVQFDGWGGPLLTLVVLGGIQVTLGVVVDPLVEGHYLAPSPLVVLLSVAFWGWLWGIPGAFIAVPLTILVMIICRQFERTRWIATLLADWKEER